MINRNGNGITLLIDSKSKYGINEYEPLKKEDDPYRFHTYQVYKKCLEEHPDYEMTIEYSGNILNNEATKKWIHCLGCAAPKINNWRKYCCTCSDYIDLSNKNNYIEVKDDKHLY